MSETKYRIIEKRCGNKSKEPWFIIQKKNFFGWKDLYTHYEEFVNDKTTTHLFRTYESSEFYLLQKHLHNSNRFYLNRNGNVYVIEYYPTLMIPG